MSKQVCFVADIAGDVDDLVAIEYLHNLGRLHSVVLDGKTRCAERESFLFYSGIRTESSIKVPNILCGGAFTPIVKYLDSGGKIDNLILNGFFAGSNIVPKQHILPKFSNMLACPSYNPNLDVDSALKLVSYGNFVAVSKNVCHHPDNVTGKWHGKHNCKPTKKLHDLLMAKEGLNIIDGKDTLCEYMPVSIYRDNFKWGAMENPCSNIKISIYKK